MQIVRRLVPGQSAAASNVIMVGDVLSSVDHTPVLGDNVMLVSSADETAFALRELLDASGLRRARNEGGAARFLSSGDVAWFETLGRRLLGPELCGAEVWSGGSPASSD